MGEFTARSILYLGVVVSLRHFLHFIKKIGKKKKIDATEFIERRCPSPSDRALLHQFMLHRTGHAIAGPEKEQLDAALSSLLQRLRDEPHKKINEDDTDFLDNHHATLERGSTLMEEVCRMFNLPDIGVDWRGHDREYGSDGIVVVVADDARQQDCDVDLDDMRSIGAIRIDPNFFVVSAEEKLAFEFIGAIFSLVPKNVRRLAATDNVMADGGTLEPAWLQIVCASLF